MAVKISKAEANYRLGDPGQGEECANCTMFRPRAKCTLVVGYIDRHDVCDYFERK